MKPATPKPATPKPAAKPAATSSAKPKINEVGKALAKVGVPQAEAAAIALVTGGNYKAASGVSMPAEVLADALLVAGYSPSSAGVISKKVAEARTKLGSKQHVKAVKKAAATPKIEPTLDKAHVESLFAKPAASSPKEALMAAKDEAGSPVRALRNDTWNDAAKAATDAGVQGDRRPEPHR